MIANQRAFDAPGTYFRAAGKAGFGGFNSPIYGPDGTIAGYATNGGIQSPERCEIQPGKTLVRFGQNGIPEQVLQGEWWLELEEFRKIEAFALEKRAGIGAAVRMLCAVPSEWSALDLMVQVNVVGTLLAYQGYGNSAVIPASTGRKAVPGKNETGLVDPFGNPVGAVFGARPPKLAQAPQFAQAEFIPVLPDTSGNRIRQLFIPGLGNGDVRRETLFFQGTRFLPRTQAQLGYAPLFI